MTTKTLAWDAASYLETSEDVAEYLAAAPLCTAPALCPLDPAKASQTASCKSGTAKALHPPHNVLLLFSFPTPPSLAPNMSSGWWRRWSTVRTP